MSSQELSEVRSLQGKRILIVARDDELFRALTSTVRRAGCVVVGNEGHHPEVSSWNPTAAVDAAILEIDKGSATVILVIEYLTDRAIPILLLTDTDPENLPANLHAHQQLRRSFTEAQLLDELALMCAH